MPVKDSEAKEFVETTRTRRCVEPCEDRMPELLEMIEIAIKQTHIISIDKLRLKPYELNIIKERYPTLEYEHGTLFFRRMHYVLPRSRKSMMIIEEGKDKNLWEEWRKVMDIKPRKGKQKEWLAWLYDEISPRVIDVLLKDKTLLYTKDELARIIRFIRFDIVDEKEFNYIIQTLIEDDILRKKNIKMEEGYTEKYYGLTKKGKELKINEPLNTPATQ